LLSKAESLNVIKHWNTFNNPGEKKKGREGEYPSNHPEGEKKWRSTVAKKRALTWKDGPRTFVMGRGGKK